MDILQTGGLIQSKKAAFVKIDVVAWWRLNGRIVLICRIELPNEVILFGEPLTLPNEWLARRTGKSRFKSRIDELVVACSSV